MIFPYTPQGHEPDGSCCEGPFEPPHGSKRRCICGPDYTGEAPDMRDDCPAHGLVGPPVAPDENGCFAWPRACEHYDDLGCHESAVTA